MPGAFVKPMLLLCSLMLLFIFIYQQSKGTQQVRMGLVFGVVVRAVAVFSLPGFSDDFYRFLWDGQLTAGGLNPFSATPAEAMALKPETWSTELFTLMNSREYHTVYPPLLQTLFTVSWRLGEGNLAESVMGLKFFVFLAETGTLYLLYQLCKKFSIHPRAVLLYALNPLVIFELSGNLHFEALMIFFLIAALWHFSELKFLPASIFMGLAVSAKLLPLMVFPFFLRRIGWFKTLLMGLIAASVFLLLFIPWLHPDLWDNFTSGLRLYFRHFEFNSSLYYAGKWYWGWEAKEWLPRLLTLAAGSFILISVFTEKKPGIRNLPQMWLLAFTAYFFAATTIHPWYLTTLVAFSVLTPFRYPLLWSLLVPFTYFTYYNGYQESEAIIWCEYLLVSALMLLEWMFLARGRSLEQFFRGNVLVRGLYRRSIPARVRIKRDRIARRLVAGEKNLDLGCGNGGLCLSLRTLGHDVTPVDVQNHSFFEEVAPVIYDGAHLPFEDGSFDTVLLITVLHHTPDPDAVLREAMRVSRKRIIVMEDVFQNAVQKHLTFFTDSLVNLEFYGHPHTNRRHEEWVHTFGKLNLHISHYESFRTLLFYRQVIYVLEKP